MEDWIYHKTISGTPQGGVISPLLANIVMDKMDKFIENELVPDYNKSERRKKTSEYLGLQRKIRKAKNDGNRETVRRYTAIQKNTPSRDPNDPNFRRLKYNRYADDFILGFAGPKEEAEEVKKKISNFLTTIGLELSEGKTLVTHATSSKARYLGYEITAPKADSIMTKRTNGNRNTTQRTINYHIQLLVPQDVKKKWISKYTKNNKPAHRPELLQMSDFEIVQTYGQELRGIVNYYSLAHNVAASFHPVKFVSMQSAARTIASKHKVNSAKIYRKYKKVSDKGTMALIVEIPNPKSDKPYRAQLGENPIKVNKNVVIDDKVYSPHHSRNELTRRLLANECELCGSTSNIQVHHVRKLANVKKRYQGMSEPPNWVRFMMERNRKTVVVCGACHRDIHSGNYDGNKVK